MVSTPFSAVLSKSQAQVKAIIAAYFLSNNLFSCSPPMAIWRCSLSHTPSQQAAWSHICESVEVSGSKEI